MSLIEEVRFFLELQVIQGVDGTWVHKQKYSVKILKKSGVINSKPINTPISPNTNPDSGEKREIVDEKTY